MIKYWGVVSDRLLSSIPKLDTDRQARLSEIGEEGFEIGVEGLEIGEEWLEVSC